MSAMMIFRTALNSSLILNRLQLNSSKLLVQQIKFQSTTATTTTTTNDGTSNRSNLISFKHLYSTSNKKGDNENNAEIESLEKKALEIQSSRIVNPFNEFVKENYKTTVASNPNAKRHEIFKIMGNTWRSMGLDQKVKYFETANKNRELKNTELQKFYAGMSEKEAASVREGLKKFRSTRRKELKKFRIRRDKRALKAPKSPPAPFFLYVKTLDRGQADLTDFIRGASMKWKALAQEDKQKFIDQNRAMEEEYQKKLAEWETQMIAEGRVDLVRRRFRKGLERKLFKKKEDAVKRGLKGFKTKRIKKLRAAARRAKRARKLRERRMKAKAALKEKKMQRELEKAKKIVELAKKIQLSSIKTASETTKSSKKEKSAKKNKSAESSDSESDGEVKTQKTSTKKEQVKTQ